MDKDTTNSLFNKVFVTFSFKKFKKMSLALIFLASCACPCFFNSDIVSTTRVQ